jgi:hypothetical protein
LLLLFSSREQVWAAANEPQISTFGEPCGKGGEALFRCRSGLILGPGIDVRLRSVGLLGWGGGCWSFLGFARAAAQGDCRCEY